MRVFCRMLGLLFAGTSFAYVLLFSSTANALPAFARKNYVPCSTCHLAWPLLNETGRKYKENGFRFKRDVNPLGAISDFLKFDKRFPISAHFKSRPYDKEESARTNVRALHEAEIMVAGTPAKDFSAFFEIEAEDEDGFNAQVAKGWVGWHLNDLFNIELSYAPLFFASPYDSLASGRKLTRGRNPIVDKAFGGADNNGGLRKSHQSIGVYGRAFKKLFYNFGYAGVGGGTEGKNASTLFGRLALDVVPNITVGAFGTAGRCQSSAANCARDRDFKRVGVDTQMDFANFRLQGAYIHATDDGATAGSGTADNDSWYLGGAYVFERVKGGPWIVPSFRFEQNEENNGTDDFSELTATLTYYPYENVKLFLEGFKQLDVPSGQEKNGRLTLQMELAF